MNINKYFRQNYKLRLKISVILSLIIIISIFKLSEDIVQWQHEPDIRITTEYIYLSSIPATGRSAAKSVKPPVPKIRIESDLAESDIILEDTYIFETSELGDDATGVIGEAGNNKISSAGPRYIPRPIFEIIPEFPEALREEGHKGIVSMKLLVNRHGSVDSVVILANTTSNKIIGALAIEAAKKTRFSSGKNLNSIWIKHTVKFE
jgi:TonB family protein